MISKAHEQLCIAHEEPQVSFKAGTTWQATLPPSL
jgi:hypothetical protein